MLNGSLQTSRLAKRGAGLRREQFRRTSSRPSGAVGDQATCGRPTFIKVSNRKSPHFATGFLAVSIASKSRHPHGNQREEHAVIVHIIGKGALTLGRSTQGNDSIGWLNRTALPAVPGSGSPHRRQRRWRQPPPW